MKIDLTPRDRGIIDAAMKMHAKGLDSVIKAMDRLTLTTLQAAGELERVNALREAVITAYADTPDLQFTREFTGEELATLHVSLFLYLEKLGKVEDAQEELSIETNDTDARKMNAQDLSDRLRGQATLALA